MTKMGYDINELLGTKTRPFRNATRDATCTTSGTPGPAANRVPPRTSWIPKKRCMRSSAIWTTRKRAWPCRRRRLYWTRGYAMRHSAATWSRCCARERPPTTSTSQVPWCVPRTLRTCPRNSRLEGRASPSMAHETPGNSLMKEFIDFLQGLFRRLRAAASSPFTPAPARLFRVPM